MIDFVNETVCTLAGNGTKGSDYRGGGTGNSQARFRDKVFLNHMQLQFVVHCNGVAVLDMKILIKFYELIDLSDTHTLLNILCPDFSS